MWMFFAGSCFGCVLGFLAFALFSSGKQSDEDCKKTCPAINVRDMDIRACCERIKTLERANAALRGANKRLVFENQQIGFFRAKEA